jgi:hypothetical protein
VCDGTRKGWVGAGPVGAGGGGEGGEGGGGGKEVSDKI